MKKASLTCILLTITLFAKAQIKVEENPPQKTSPTQTSVAIFDSTTNHAPKYRKLSTYIGKEIFFLDNGGEFFSDSLLEHRIYPKPQLKYYIVLDRIWFSGREYYDSYLEEIVTVKSRDLYKLKGKDSDSIMFYDPELYNPLMPDADAFNNLDVIWVSYYNYLKTELIIIGKRYAITETFSYSDYNTGKTDYYTGEKIQYKYNDIWTVEDIKIIKTKDNVWSGNSYVLRLALKNSNGNVITLVPDSKLLVDKNTFDGYIKQYGATMVKSAFERELKVGMPKILVRQITKQFKNKNISINNSSKGEEWTIHDGSKIIHINFNKAGKVTSWREEDKEVLQLKGKVSVSPR